MGEVKPKVLIAASDWGGLAALRACLGEDGLEVVEAANAIQAVSMTRAHVPALVLLDSRLDGGVQVALRAIRGYADVANIAAVVLLAEGATEAAMLAAGAQACVKAPVNPDDLARAVMETLGKSANVQGAPAEVIGKAERLADLEETELLDSPPTEQFDRLTRLAARLIGSPISLVSLVDRDRQFFKSQVGLGPPISEQRQTDLQHSFCQWVVSAGEPLAVGDARSHPVLRDNPAVREFGVAAYAGVPLLGRRSQAIGSFCVVDMEPRQWEQHHVELLQDLGAAIRAMAVARTVRDWPITSGMWPPSWVGLIADSTLGVTRVLRRYADRMQAQDRRDLYDVLDHQALLLVEPQQSQDSSAPPTR